MIQRDRDQARATGSGIGILLLALALWLGAAFPAHAQQGVPCSSFGGVLDGFAGDIPPSNIQIDQNCTIRNYPASNPLRTNFRFLTQPGQTNQRWLIVFDNVVHTGQMSCNSVLNHKIWFVNGSSSSIQQGCQNLLIPVEKIDKKVPVGQTTAAVGVPFTYSLIIPVLFDAATGQVIDYTGSGNDLHSIVVWDDLNATGADLSYVSHTAVWRGTTTPVPHSFSNAGGFLTFDFFPGDPTAFIPAFAQIELQLTVVLDNTPANAPGTQFVNTAKWQFGRLIEGVFYVPLPGEWGISPPLTIAAPELVTTKTGPATLGLTLNLGQWGVFGLDVQNTGLSDAWNVTLLDQMPDGPTGGTCDLTPQILSAQVFAADGTTPVSPPLVQGTDYSVSYASAPTCELTLTMQTAAAKIGPTERLIVSYRTQLDANSQDGAALTNVAGATRWFNGDPNNPTRVPFARTLTDGTPGVVDHEDAHTVTVDLQGYFFEKTVANLTSGASPATTAAPGDTLRYTLRLQATNVPLNDVTFFDDLGAMNALPVFVPGSLALVAGTIPAGADTSNTDPAAGTNGAGILDVRNLNVPVNSQISLSFDITVDPTLPDGTVILNQADLINVVKIADSDDPTINGQADPAVVGDEDPTRIVVVSVPVGPLVKDTTQATAAIGVPFSYLVTVPETPYAFPIYDVRITDDLIQSAADLRFVSASRVAGSQPWTPSNTGTPTNLVIEDPNTGIDIPAGEQVVVEITVVLENTPTNVGGLVFTNAAGFSYNRIDGDDASRLPGSPATSPPMTIVEPALTLVKSGPAGMTVGTPDTFTLDAHNTGVTPAWNTTLSDQLPDGPTGGTCDVAPSAFTAQVFQADGVTPVSAPLVQGTDFTVAFAGPSTCLLTVSIVSAAGTIGPDERLIVTYQIELDVDSQNGVMLTNVAGATEWFSADASSLDRRTYTETLSDGTVGVLDHEDAHTVTVALPPYLFEKTVTNLTTGANPAATATPGDVLRYQLLLQNTGPSLLDDLAVFDELDALNAVPTFAPGTLQLVTVPAGADTSNTSSTGGAQGTGVVDIRNLSVPAGGQLLIEFDVTLAPVIADGTLVTNQSELLIHAAPFALSDDPNVNGPADPFVSGDEDPTRVLIQSAPVFQVEKVSAYVTGSPTVLLAGETLRYTITVRNVGTADALDAALRDDVPLNTQYLAGSTTLNGTPVPDGPGGSLPLAAGIPIHAPADPTPGTLLADPSMSPANVATIVFDVVVDPGVPDGTIISNQAFVSAIAAGIAGQPSDDPRTPIPDDPTRDVVGNSPLLFAPKSAALLVDAGTPGVVDPGDVLHYTITIYNTGPIPATGVMLTDAVPADTTYVADSTTLNGIPVGQPDGGVSPLIAGIPVSSSDLTPPLPGPGAGTLSPGESAQVEFDLQVNAGVPAGTIISNQATVSSNELPALLTDGDGNPATGPEPTQVVVGAGQQLTITKQVAVVGGGAALAGSQLEYVVNVVNIAAVPAFNVVITDDLDAPVAGQLTYVAGSASMNGALVGINVVGPIITADYSGSFGPLQPGQSIVLRFRASIDPSLAMGTTVTNTGTVMWNTPPQSASASVSVDVGGVPGVGVLNGTVWHDADFDLSAGGAERRLAGWTVDLYRNGTPVQSAVTDSAGAFSIAGVAPNAGSADQYELRFVAPGAGANTASLGMADSAFTNGPQRIADIIVASGSNLQDLNLPIQPNGVVYDAIQRFAIAGATLDMLSAPGGSPLPSSCFDDPVQQGQLTGADGFYKFDLNFSDPACPVGGSYLISVGVPATGYTAGISQIIPPASDASTAPFSVPGCPGGPGDAVLATAQHCEAQTSELAPPPSVPPGSAGTRYELHLTLDASQVPGSSQIFNNHIPLDPVLTGAVAITKTTPSINVVRGQLVPYEIIVSNELGAGILDLSIVDDFPAGFHYVDGSARIDGVPVAPTQSGQRLVWANVGVGAASRRSLRLLLAVGAGVTEGEYVNRAQAFSSQTGAPLSGQAQATVRVAPDATFDCTDVIGKVFDDRNRDGVQDAGEQGLPGVRLVTARGLAATTDAYGRFHITCAITPNEARGSNFILKLDDRTLPTGFRMSNRRAQVQRATRGKALRFSFGASIHRVVGLDMADEVFEPGSLEMRPQWRPRLDMLLDELRKAPATLRLSYVADVEDPRLVDARLTLIRDEIMAAWQELNCCYPLAIEPEVFWLRGGPPDRDSLRLRGDR